MTDLYGRIICALTHNMEVCEKCRQCEGKNFAEIRVNLVKELEKQKEVLEIIERIIKDKSNYINVEFADGKKLYIDGTVEYKNEEEKKLVKEWLENVR